MAFLVCISSTVDAVLLDLASTTLLPLNASQIHVATVPADSVASYNISLTGPSGATAIVTAIRVASYGTLVAQIPSSVASAPGPLVVASIPPAGSGDAVFRAAITLYAVPVFASVRANMTTGGLSSVLLILAANSPPLPTLSSISGHVVCARANASGAGTAAALLLDVAHSTGLAAEGGLAYAYNAPALPVATDEAGASLGPAGGLSMVTRALPDDCGSVFVYISFNGGLHAHLATPAALPVRRTSPVRVFTIFPNGLDVPWSASHNLARLALSGAFRTAVDASQYAVDAWKPEPVTGSTDRASVEMLRAITQLNASLIFCVGGEFYEAAARIAAAHPEVNFLITSDLRAPLNFTAGILGGVTGAPVAPLPNVATGHGRVREAYFYIGFAAAATSRTGRLGVLLALDLPSSRASLNGFALGAQAAHAAGLARGGLSAPPPHVLVWAIGSFNDRWAEVTAAADLLKRGCDFVFATTDNAAAVRAAVHAAGGYSAGQYEDARAQGADGDRVLLSLLLPTQVIYAEFVRRTATRARFGPESWERGLGAGVEVTDPSPAVPLAAQAELARRLAVSRESDAHEEVLCGTLIDNNGTVRLNGTSGATASGLPPVEGEGGALCLHPDDVWALDWLVQGVEMPPVGASCTGASLGGAGPGSACTTWVPPPQPTDAPVPVSAAWQAGVSFLPVLTLLAAGAATALVWTCRRERIIRLASPTFLVSSNVGAVLYACALLTVGLAPISDASCTVRLWISGIGFALLFGACFVKLHRVARIVNNASLLRLRLTDAYVARQLALVMAGEILALVLINVLLPPAALQVHSPSASGSGPGTVWSYCGTGGKYGSLVAGDVLLTSAQFVLLLWGAVLAYQTRHAPEEIKEGPFIAVAIYSVVLCEACGFVLTSELVFRSSPRVQLLAGIIRLGVPPLLTLGLLYLPKIIMLRRARALRLAHEQEGGSSGSGAASGSSVTAGTGKPEAGQKHGLQRIGASFRKFFAAGAGANGSGESGGAAQAGGSLSPRPGLPVSALADGGRGPAAAGGIGTLGSNAGPIVVSHSTHTSGSVLGLGFGAVGGGYGLATGASPTATGLGLAGVARGMGPRQGSSSESGGGGTVLGSAEYAVGVTISTHAPSHGRSSGADSRSRRASISSGGTSSGGGSPAAAALSYAATAVHPASQTTQNQSNVVTFTRTAGDDSPVSDAASTAAYGGATLSSASQTGAVAARAAAAPAARSSGSGGARFSGTGAAVGRGLAQLMQLPEEGADSRHWNDQTPAGSAVFRRTDEPGDVAPAASVALNSTATAAAAAAGDTGGQASSAATAANQPSATASVAAAEATVNTAAPSACPAAPPPDDFAGDGRSVSRNTSSGTATISLPVHPPGSGTTEAVQPLRAPPLSAGSSLSAGRQRSDESDAGFPASPLSAARQRSDVSGFSIGSLAAARSRERSDGAGVGLSSLSLHGMGMPSPSGDSGSVGDPAFSSAYASDANVSKAAPADPLLQLKRVDASQPPDDSAGAGALLRLETAATAPVPIAGGPGSGISLPGAVTE